MFDSFASEFRGRGRESAEVLLVVVGHRLSGSLRSGSNLPRRMGLAVSDPNDIAL